MYKFPIDQYKRCCDVPTDALDEQKFSIYLVDRSWNYTFVNSFALASWNKTRDELVGRNIFVGFEIDREYRSFLTKVENGTPSSTVTKSPLSGKRVSVSGYPLEDGFYFAVSVLPDKEDLMNELRQQLKNR